MADYSIGIDLGGTNLRAAAVSASGEMLKKIAGSTPISEGPDAVLDDMARAVKSLFEEFGHDNLAGVGAGVPGNIDMDAGVVVRWGNAPGFNGYPMRDSLSKRLDRPVVLENDANSAALGECWIGAGREVEDLILLTLGTGIGGGIIAGGKILHGAIGMAGELGHITVVPNGNPCGCGNRGCVERYASATAIGAMARGVGLGTGLNAKDVADLAHQGDERARQVYETAGETLGTALAALINIFNFPLYLIGGGVVGSWDLLSPYMLTEIERRSLTYRLSLEGTPTKILPAALGSDAGLFGAASLAFNASK